MAWQTVHDLVNVIPVNVFDANGMVIRRATTGFDAETGEVESIVKNRNGDFKLTDTGDIATRREVYPAPLAWKRISAAQAQEESLRYWDLEGR